MNTVWFIERRTGNEYLTIEHGHFEWTPERSKALHLTRERDAVSIIVLASRISAHLYAGIPFALTAEDFPPYVVAHEMKEEDYG